MCIFSRFCQKHTRTTISCHYLFFSHLMELLLCIRFYKGNTHHTHPESVICNSGWALIRQGKLFPVVLPALWVKQWANWALNVGDGKWEIIILAYFLCPQSSEQENKQLNQSYFLYIHYSLVLTHTMNSKPFLNPEVPEAVALLGSIPIPTNQSHQVSMNQAITLKVSTLSEERSF